MASAALQRAPCRVLRLGGERSSCVRSAYPAGSVVARERASARRVVRVVLYSASAWVGRLAAVAVVVLVGFASAQALDVEAPSWSGDECQQTILLPMASSRSGAVALSASFASSTPDRVLVTVALRYSRALFGVEFALKAEYPGIVASIVEMEGARMRFGAAGAGEAVEIVDLLYLRNTGTEFVTFPLSVEAFRSLARAPQPTFGRVDTERAYLEFDLPAAFFEALADGFVPECLDASAPTGVPAGAAAAPADAGASASSVCSRPAAVQVDFVGPSEGIVCVNVAVLRVRDAPGLQANVVGRAELGTQGRLVSVEHRDVDGFRWWHVRFPDDLQGWVADGDAELDYLVRVPSYGGGGGRLTPFAPLPDLAPLAAAVFEAASLTPVACSEWHAGRAPVSACARAAEGVRGPWGAEAVRVRDAVDPLLRAAGLSPRVVWQDDGGESMVSLHSEWVDEAHVVLVVIGIGPDEDLVEVALLQWFP